ncbi:MAG TPA: PEPxxWA-CTERM sorting domain-containing protein [Caulobacteraceae bacterium]|jgi:hypothetical protein
MVCGYYINQEICAQSQAISPITLKTGDTVNISVSYSSPLIVPASPGENAAWTGIDDQYQAPGPGLPGPLTANVNSTPENFQASTLSNLLTNYSMPPTLNEYVATVTYCCNVSSPAFSLTGLNSTILVTTPDSNPIVNVFWGFSAILPATPQTLTLVGAPNPGSPAILPPGLIGQIDGSIDPGSSEFYGFNWKGGIFQVQANVPEADVNDVLALELFDPYTRLVIPGDSVALNSADGFTNLLTVANLPAGSYDVALVDAAGTDPNFTLTFDTPIGSVPEPATWALMMAGVGAIGSFLRGSRKARVQRIAVT